MVIEKPISRKEGILLNRVGLIVKQKRESIGMSQNMLAKKAGVSQAALSALESETKNPNVETVFLLAQALDCTVSELLGEKPADTAFLTPRQRQLLDLFQQLNDAGKDFLLSQTISILQQPAFRQEGSMPSAV